MILISTLLPRGARALTWNPRLWDFQPPQQAEEPGTIQGGPADVHRSDRLDTPTLPHRAVSTDSDDSETAQRRAQRQTPSPTHPRPLPPLPPQARGSHDAQRQRVLHSPTHPAPLPSLPLPTHQSHHP